MNLAFLSLNRNFGASFPLILSHIARYAPSSDRKICIQINHKILLSNFVHLLNKPKKSHLGIEMLMDGTAHVVKCGQNSRQSYFLIKIFPVLVTIAYLCGQRANDL